MGFTQPLIVILCTALGTVFGLTLMTLWPNGRSKPERPGPGPFDELPEARLWFATIALTCGVAAGVATALWPSWWHLMSTQRWFIWLPSLLAIAGLYVVALFGPRNYRRPVQFPLWRHTTRIAIVFLIACVPIGMAITGMVFAASEGRDLIEPANPAGATALLEMVELRRNLMVYLGASALLISIAIIATAALRQALLAWFAAEPAAISELATRTDELATRAVGMDYGANPSKDDVKKLVTDATTIGRRAESAKLGHAQELLEAAEAVERALSGDDTAANTHSAETTNSAEEEGTAQPSLHELVGTLADSAVEVRSEAEIRAESLAESQPQQDDKAFPASYLVLYGVFFSTLLAVVFVPTYLDLQSSGWALVTRALNSEGTTALTEDWFTQRESLVSLLSLDVGWSATFASAFGVLTPLASGFLSTYAGLDAKN